MLNQFGSGSQGLEFKEAVIGDAATGQLEQSNVIPRGHSLGVRVKWSTRNVIWPPDLKPNVGWMWDFRLVCETLGATQSAVEESTSAAFNPDGEHIVYLEIKGGLDTGGSPSVAYAVTATFQLKDEAGEPRPAVAFFDFGIVQVFDAPEPLD